MIQVTLSPKYHATMITSMAFSEEHPGFKDSEIIRSWTLPSQIREQSGFTKKPIGLGPNLKDNRLDSFYRTVS